MSLRGWIIHALMLTTMVAVIALLVAGML